MRALVIPVRGGSPQIPDGVLFKDGTCWVVDESVVADNADLDDAHDSKCAKYNTPAVRDWCQSHLPSQEGSWVPLFGALIFNWRGAMSPRSANMCKRMGLSESDTKILSVWNEGSEYIATSIEALPLVDSTMLRLSLRLRPFTPETNISYLYLFKI